MSSSFLVSRYLNECVCVVLVVLVHGAVLFKLFFEEPGCEPGHKDGHSRSIDMEINLKQASQAHA